MVLHKASQNPGAEPNLQSAVSDGRVRKHNITGNQIVMHEIAKQTQCVGETYDSFYKNRKFFWAKQWTANPLE